MKLTKSKLKQLIKEELQNITEATEENYRLKTGVFCLGKQCRADARIVELETSRITAAAKGMGATKEEALQKAMVKLQNKVKSAGIDVTKLKKL